MRIERRKTEWAANNDSKTPELRYSAESFTDFVDFGVNRKAALEEDKSASRKTDDHHSRHWSGTNNFPEAVEIASKGWPEGAGKVNVLAQSLLNKVTQLVQQDFIQYDVVGTDFDMGLVNLGIPDCWTEIQHDEVRTGTGTKILRLTFNCAASAGVSAETLIARGATACALVESLEYAGFRVQIELYECVRYSNEENKEAIMTIHVPVKQADSYLDRDRLAFALAHPSTLRRLCFAVNEHDKGFMDDQEYSYGTPRDIPDSERGDIHIKDGMLGEPQWKRPEIAARWILDQMKAQGIVITE